MSNQPDQRTGTTAAVTRLRYRPITVERGGGQCATSLEQIALCRVREQYPGLQRKGFSKAITTIFKNDCGFDGDTDEWDRLYAKAYRVWFIPDGWLQDTDGTFVAVEIEDRNPLKKAKLLGYAELWMLLDACDNTPTNPLRLYVFDRYGLNQRELDLRKIYHELQIRNI